VSDPGEFFVGPPAAVPAIVIIVNADQQFAEHDPEGWAVLEQMRVAQGKPKNEVGDLILGPSGEVYQITGIDVATGEGLGK
jgi:hypothetical protein